MKTNYINAVTLDLMKKLDYTPISDNTGAYIINDNFKLLQMGTIQTFSLVCIVDGDAHSPDQLKSVLENNMVWMNGIDITGISEEITLTEILVFSTKPDKSTLTVIDENRRTALTKRKFFEIIVIELDNKQIYEYSDSRIPSHDIKLFLHNRLFDHLDAFETLLDIDELINNQSPQPSLVMASNSSPATNILIGINIVVWLFGQLLLLMNGQDYTTIVGVKSTSAILHGEYWRLITPIFLHADMMHLGANSFSLLVFGQVIERIFGTKKFLIIYFVSGFIGNIASFIFLNSNSLGASGAIMGIGGSFIYIWLKNRSAFSGNARQYLTLVFLIFFNIFYGFTRPGIDNYAHIGGFIGGFLIAGALYKGEETNKSLFGACVFLLMVVGLILGFR